MKSAVYNAMADLKNARKEDNQSHGKKMGNSEIFMTNFH
jgi:hypothetical protein